MEPWIAFTLFATVTQSIRTAAQKQLASTVSAMSTTFARYAFGLPVAAVYLAILLLSNEQWRNAGLLHSVMGNSTFLLYATAAGISQILATYALVKVFAQRNFAVGTSFAKTEAIQVAVFGSLIFSEHLKGLGWLAVIVGVIGTILLSGVRFSFYKGRQPNKDGALKANMYGIASGCLFAFTSLFIREASLSLGLPLLLSASICLMYMITIQTVFCAAYIQWQERSQWQIIVGERKLCWFIGISSALGSIGWFSAMSLENPALVKTLGQVEIFSTLAITYFYFREKLARFEWLGMAGVVVAALLVLWV